MTSASERHELLTRLFAEASELAPAERAGFLERSCGGDRELRAEIEALLGESQAPLALFDDADSGRNRGGLVALLANADERWVGTVVGDCKLVELLGSGGMGSVYRGRQSNPARDVAVKILRGSRFEEAALRRFEVETELLARLRHPGIAQVFSAGVHSQGPLRVPYCVLELVDGAQPITEFCSSRALGVTATLRLFLQACDALQHAHEHRVVHRDVKPGNLLVDRDGRLRVIDFGIARALASDDERAQRTRTGQVLGTPAYMSPEQFAARADELDTRADVYSLGVVLYELLAGRLPIEVEGAALHEISRRVLEDEPPRLSTVRRALRGDLETIVAKTLSKDATRRYGSAGALAADLRRYLSDEPITARPATALYQMTKFARRHRGLVAGAFVALGALVTGTIVATTSAFEALRARDEARRLAYEANLAAVASALTSFDFAAARKRLDEAPEELRGWEWRHFDARLDDASFAIAPLAPPSPPWGVRDLEYVQVNGEKFIAVAHVIPRDGLEAVELRLHAATDGSLHARWQVAPDRGMWVAISSDRVWLSNSKGDVWTLDPATGAEQGLRAHFEADDVTSRYALTPLGGTRVLVARRVGGFQRILDLATGKAELPPALPADESSFVPRGPTADGRGLISFGKYICLTPFAADEPGAVLAHAGEPILVYAVHPDGQRFFAACRDGSVEVIRFAQGALTVEHRFQAHSDVVTGIAVSPDGRFLTTSGGDRAIHVWRVEDFALVNTLVGSDAGAGALSYDATGEHLALSAGLRGVLVFDEPERADPRTLRDFEFYAYSLALAPDGERLAAGDWGQFVHVWDRRTTAPIFSVRLAPLSRPVQTLEWSRDSKRLLASVVADPPVPSLHVLDAQTGEVLASASAESMVFAASWIDDERFVAACGGRLEIRRASDAGLERTVGLVPIDAAVMPWSIRWDFAKSPDRTQLALACPDGSVRCWELPEFRPVFAIGVHKGPAHAVAWSADGAQLVIAGADRRICVLDARTGTLLHETTAHASAVFDVCFSPDGARLFSGSDDDTIRVWSTTTWSELARLDGHSDYVFSLDCAPDGQLLSASGDRTVRMWDTRSRARVLRESVRR
ncbi:MAG: protein kinase [Planctomycetota bacterium]|nr:protein kinase [Planctomycetota bacterium]